MVDVWKEEIMSSMNSKYKYLIKNTGILTISNFSSKILVFFLVPLYTSILSTDEYGTYDLALSTIQLMFPILTANIIDGVMRFTIEKVRGSELSDIITIAVRFLMGSIAVIGLLLIVNGVFGIWDAINGFEILIFFYYISYVLNQFCIQLAKGMERIKDMGIAGVLGTLAMIGFNILFLCVLKIGLAGFFAANILGQIVPVFYFTIKMNIWKYVRFSINRELQKQMLIYSLPLVWSTIGWWVNSASDKYIVTFLWGIAANGLLSVAYKIPTILNILQGIFVQAWQVSAIKEYGTDESESFYKTAFIYLNTLMCIGCAVLIFLTRPISHILFAKDFYAAWIYVPFLLISSVFNASAGYIGPILAARKDSKSMAKSAFYGAGANIVLNIVFVWLIGVQGATIATAISSFIIYYVRRTAIGSMIISDKHKMIILSWVVICIEAAAEVYFKNSYIVFMCTVVVICIYRKTVINLMRRLLSR